MDLSHQKLTDRDLPTIIDKLGNKSYLSLQLQGNAITSQGITIITDSLLKNFSTLQDLWLSNNCISDVGVQTLTRTFLSNNRVLKQLHLGSNCITDQGVQYLAGLLRSNVPLTDLWLYNNQITDEGVQHLTHALRTENRNLKHLDLQWNKAISDPSADAFGEMFNRNRTLIRLNLRKCSLSMEGKIDLLQNAAVKKDFKLII